MRLHEPFFAAASDTSGSGRGATTVAARRDPRPHPPLEPLIELFDERAIFGIVWFDTSLTTTARFGDLAHFVEIGVPLSHAVLAMYGLDEQIAVLRRMPDRSVELPNVATHTALGSTPKLNYSIFWMPKQQSYVMLISRVLSRSDLELELSNQGRARQIAEEELVKSSRKLEQANRDLAEFAYVISHDLRAPMRALNYTAEDLAAAAAAQSTSPEVGALLAELRVQTRRMGSMLDGLLAYSRIGRKKEAVEAVDTRALVEVVVRGLQPRSGFTIAIGGDWPTIYTLAAPLDLVLRNLVDNALKHHDRGDGHVALHAERRPVGFVTITVSDDGPGIPEQYQSAVFQPFVKLKPGEEATGAASSGIGLSLVRRTVESVGGALRLQSIGRGTTFVIEWPEIEPDPLLESVGARPA